MRGAWLLLGLGETGFGERWWMFLDPGNILGAGRWLSMAILSRTLLVGMKVTITLPPIKTYPLTSFELSIVTGYHHTVSQTFGKFP